MAKAEVKIDLSEFDSWDLIHALAEKKLDNSERDEVFRLITNVNDSIRVESVGDVSKLEDLLQLYKLCNPTQIETILTKAKNGQF